MDVSASAALKRLKRILPDYGSLTAEQIERRSRDLKIDDQLYLLAVEQQTKNRLTITRRLRRRIIRHPEQVKRRLEREAQRGFTILLGGNTGVGKSHTLNSLFGREVAPTNAFTAETKEVKRYEGEYNGICFTVLDTPGLGEFGEDGEDRDERYLRLMREACPRPDVLWFVMSLDDRRVDAADARTFALFQQHFGPDIWRRAVLVLTHADRVPPSSYGHQFKGRNRAINAAFKRVTKRRKSLPVVAVANGQVRTPDGAPWLGELFTTTLERLNPKRLSAFYLAFARELDIPAARPRPKRPEQGGQAGSDTEVLDPKAEGLTKGRIRMSASQRQRVRKTMDGTIIGVTAISFANVGAHLDGATGGATLGAGAVIGGVFGAALGTLMWLRYG